MGACVYVQVHRERMCIRHARALITDVFLINGKGFNLSSNAHVCKYVDV